MRKSAYGWEEHCTQVASRLFHLKIRILVNDSLALNYHVILLQVIGK